MSQTKYRETAQSCPFCGEILDASVDVCCCCGADLIRRSLPPRPIISLSFAAEPRAPASDRTFYVYLHRDTDGRIFYVGKGKGQRAWSTDDRDRSWHKYVAERSGGTHTVEVFRDGLNDEEACELEAFLIGAHGQHLVNWINPGRQMDYAAIAKYHERRDKNRAFVAATRSLESTDPELAVTRYRQALREMDDYEGVTRETGLLAGLGGVGPYPDVAFLDRLTLCLVRLGRMNEAKAEADQFFAKYPATRERSLARAIRKRVARPK